ncbi:hypothetical protein Tco_0327894 [Tanacetum coccineum]
MAGSDDENPPPPPPQTPTQQAPHTVSTIKLPILKKGEYDIRAMKMEHYLSHTDYPIWEVIQKGNGPVSVSTDTNGVIKVLPLKTGKEILARERERKARTTLIMALPEDYLAKFHKMTDAKEMWDDIKSRFGGNDESKKMQKYILKQQFEGFSISNSEGLHKGYDRTKPGVDSLSFDDIYNNLRVFEIDVKGSTGSSSSAQNVAFVSSESTNSTNDVSTTYGATTSSRYNSQRENSSSYTNELMHSFFANQSSVAMISIRLKKFYKKTWKKLQFDAVVQLSKEQEKSSFAFVNTVKHVKTHSFGHLIRDCNFHEKRMAKQVELNKKKSKGTGQGENRPGAFLVKIRDNTFNGIIGENVFEHRNKFLKVVGPIKINGVSQERFRLSIFPISLAGAAVEWFKKDCIGLVTTWEDLVEKFIKKFYQLSDDNEEIEAEEDDDPDNITDIFKIEGIYFDY